MGDKAKVGNCDYLLKGGFVDRMETRCDKKRSDQVIQSLGCGHLEGWSVISRVEKTGTSMFEGGNQGRAGNIWFEMSISYSSKDTE